MEILRAIPERVLDRNQESFVDSKSITRYLAFNIPEVPEDKLSNKVNLDFYYDYFNDIANIPHIVPVFQKEELDIKYQHDEEDIGIEFLDELRGLIDGRDKERDERKKAQGEVGTVIYFDKKKSIITNTTLTRGLYNKSQLDYDSISDEMREGMIVPLLEVHTHPDTSLFSSVDYTRMILEGAHSRRRIRGSVVICPDRQFLALATIQTPVYSESEISERVAILRDNVTEFCEENTTDAQEAARTFKAEMDIRFKETMIKASSHMEELSRLRDRYGLSLEETLEAFRSIVRMVDPEMQSLVEQGSKLRAAARIDKKRLYDEAHIAMAKSLHVKLYSSTNMRDFHAFTA